MPWSRDQITACRDADSQVDVFAIPQFQRRPLVANFIPAAIEVILDSQRDLRRPIRHRKAGRDYVLDRLGHEHEICGPCQQPFLPCAILTNPIWARKHDALSHRETRVAGILDDTGALVAEHQRRLGPRVSTREDRVIERRDAGGRDAN
jgi:hypothetical protein